MFDSAGRTHPPVSVLVNDEFAHTLDFEAKGQRLVRWGFVAIAVSVPLLWYGWKNDAGVVWWPVLASINLVFAGLRLIQWGHGLKELRYRRKRSRSAAAGKYGTIEDCHASKIAKYASRPPNYGATLRLGFPPPFENPKGGAACNQKILTAKHAENFREVRRENQIGALHEFNVV